MPRSLYLSVLLVCAGCAGSQSLTPVGQPQPVLTPPPSVGATSSESASPHGRLTVLQTVPYRGERYDDWLIEENAHQPVLRPLNP